MDNMDNNSKETFILDTLSALEKLKEVHKQIADIHHSVVKLYPVAVVEDDTFFVFDLDESGEKYEFKLEAPTAMPVPKGVLAAFPLDFYDGKPSAVITDEAFQSLEGLISIFHEFVHCYQWANGEQEIRSTLNIQEKYQKEKNQMWEITHPFPYEDGDFASETMELGEQLKEGRQDAVFSYHRRMRDRLTTVDYEYMIWQEWKEGFARYIENLMRERVGLKPCQSNLNPKFSRVSFYEIGSIYIDALVKNHPHYKTDLCRLYHRMYDAE